LTLSSNACILAFAVVTRHGLEEHANHSHNHKLTPLLSQLASLPMIFDSPFMARSDEDDKKTMSSSIESPWPYHNGGLHGRQSSRVLLLSSRGISATTTSTAQNRSVSIPLPSSHVHRTQSELQLHEDEEVAEQRDSTMFYRLVNGIRERHGMQSHQGPQVEQNVAHHARLCEEQPHSQRQRIESDQYHIATISEASPMAVDDWSIDGYHSPRFASQTAPRHLIMPQETEDCDVGCDIFPLDP
jgi:hypothetical protein